MAMTKENVEQALDAVALSLVSAEIGVIMNDIDKEVKEGFDIVVLKTLVAKLRTVLESGEKVMKLLGEDEIFESQMKHLHNMEMLLKTIEEGKK